MGLGELGWWGGRGGRCDRLPAGWPGLYCAGLGWVGVGWVGGWPGLSGGVGMVGLGWAGLCGLDLWVGWVWCSVGLCWWAGGVLGWSSAGWLARDVLGVVWVGSGSSRRIERLGHQGDLAAREARERRGGAPGAALAHIRILKYGYRSMQCVGFLMFNTGKK